MTKKKRTTTDGLEILDRLHFGGRPARQRALAKAKLNAQIAQEIHRLRIEAGLSQKDLAELVGTTASVICRLEDADYTGHSLSMLQRISVVLEHRLEVRFIPIHAAAQGRAKHKATA